MKLEVRGLNKSFGDKKVLEDISFEVSSGKALGLLGRNGAGKTTTIRLLMGVFDYDKGEVLIDGMAINHNKIGIGYLPEERGMYPKRKVMEQLIYFGALKGLSKKEAIKSANYWLERLEMTEYCNKKLETLSKGNQQKIQLITTVIADPQIVILDEPFSGLDPVNAMLLKDVVKELVEKNKIVIFSSHQMSYVEEFCENIAILNKGKIVLAGNIKQIKKSYDRSKIIISSPDVAVIKNNLKESCDQDDEELTVHLQSPSDKADLLVRLANMNADINEVRVYEPTLNDIFVEYTEDRI